MINVLSFFQNGEVETFQEIILTARLVAKLRSVEWKKARREGFHVFPDGILENYARCRMWERMIPIRQ